MPKNNFSKILAIFTLIFSLPVFSIAQDINERIAKLEADTSAAQASADNAFILLCSALVLLTTVPGLDATARGETAYVFEGELIHISGANSIRQTDISQNELIPSQLALETD